MYPSAFGKACRLLAVADEPYRLIGKVVLAGLTFCSALPFSTPGAVAVLMVTVGVHELGHVWVMRWRGIPTAGFFFIPLLGAVTIPLRQYRTLNDHVVVALGGPLFGAIMVVGSLFCYILSPDPMWAGVAELVALGNVLQMLPFPPLDGGLVVTALLRSLRGRECGKYEPGSGIEDLLSVVNYLLLIGVFLFVVFDPIVLEEALAAWEAYSDFFHKVPS